MESLNNVIKLFVTIGSDYRLVIMAVVIILLAMVILAFVTAILTSKIHDIKKKNFSKLMGFVDDILYSVWATSVNRMNAEANQRICTVVCPHGVTESCEYLVENPDLQKARGKEILKINILDRTKERIKDEIHCKEYLGLSDLELIGYKNRLGVALIVSNRLNISESEFNTYKLIAHTDSIRFTEQEACFEFGRIVDEAIRISKAERGEITRAIMTFVLPIKMVKSVFKAVIHGK